MLKRKMISSEPINDVHIYTIPSRKEYKKNSLSGDVTWDELYGKKKCYVCNEHFEEGDEYVAEASVRKRKRWVMPCRHATCDPTNPPKRSRRKAVVEEDEEDTKKIYTDVEEKIGETLLLHGKVMTIIDKDSDDEGDYIVVEETEDDDEEEDDE